MGLTAPGRPAAARRTGPDVVVDADVLGRHRTGDETYVRALLEALGRDAGGLRVGAVVRRAALAPVGVEPVVLPGANQAARLAWRLPRRLEAAGPGLAHVHYVLPPAYRGRAVVTVHDLSFVRLPELEDRLAGLALRTLVPPSLRRAALVLTGTAWSKADLVERYRLPEEKVVVTPYGVGPAFRPDGPRPERPPYLLFVGALRPRKDPLGALEAFRRLDGDLHLVMIGPDKGLRPAVDAYVAAHGLGARVEVLGHVDEATLTAHYRGAEALVLPTRYEGFGLPVVEAMASGTPVVTTTVSCLPEVAGAAAVLVPPGDPAALADGVARALAERPRLRAAGLERAAGYRWEVAAAATAAAYRRALAA